MYRCHGCPKAFHVSNTFAVFLSIYLFLLIFPYEAMTDNKIKVNINEDKIDNDQSDNEDYSYSDESLCSDDDISQDSDEVTNVTRRSSMSSMTSQDNDKSTNPSRSESKISTNQGRSCSSLNNQSCDQRANRRNMSFTNLEMMRIERENQYLLRKIMAQQRPVKSIQLQTTANNRLSSSAINRKKLQRRIEEENMVSLYIFFFFHRIIYTNNNYYFFR